MDDILVANTEGLGPIEIDPWPNSRLLITGEKLGQSMVLLPDAVDFAPYVRIRDWHPGAPDIPLQRFETPQQMASAILRALAGASFEVRPRNPVET
ncbi:MAG: hypothetical protein IT349_09065 [Candidatus Eisenbacteria bacterium]|nr:hypothetical protein [Candidatus Eisenbacteria bacterium]